MREFSVPALYEVPADGNLTVPIHTNASEVPDAPLVSRKVDGRWEQVTAEQFLAEVYAAAKGLIASGVGPGDRVGLMSRTRYEWTLLDFAIWCAGGVTVPVYETSSAEQVEWILGDSGAVACVVESATHDRTVAQVRDALPALKSVWRIDAGGVEELGRAGEGVPDEEVRERCAALTAETPATIIYTSGTTGRPKGCVLTHGNFLAEIGNVVRRLAPLFQPGRSSLLLFLPLAHVLGRIMQIGAVMGRINMGHCPDTKQLTEELAGYRPTFVVAVPRVFEKVYNSARARAQADGRGRIFDAAAATAIAYSRALDHGRPGPLLRLRHALFDRLVYRRLRGALGGRCTHAISGGAPLGERLGHFFRGIGFTVLEGYGLTESSAATTFNPLERQKVGTVGQPLPGSAVRIGDDGEVLLKGGHIFTGYWNNPEATAEALTDGWFHTGDLGALDEDGYLRIVGRKKEIIVTAGGKNVAPAVIEDRVRAHPLVGECMVVGDGRPFVGMLITLDPEFLDRWKRDNGFPQDASVARLAREPRLREAVQEAVDEGNKAVSHAEQVKRFRILDVEFTEAGGHLTPSLKLKRSVVLRDFAADIEWIYGGDRPSPSGATASRSRAGTR
ncbi:AMP-dependent synthetase/ligase [Allostreptomyces psammosilenae]|uniref:Acyl-CoA synthetase n=1 Tax=Allostreptomyces psammosilenae TaxID=1892865 RepID=A0A852ZYZ6_9ACTN|nr:AMP-dependent synthetase/ligase [Allostreptomyces psammosilenae]NYI07047.1 long-chain acyl-CoA synthetase [Allostreptomyces psammosilenae]